MSLDPLVTHHRARVAALSRWSQESDPAGATLAARTAFLARFEDEVDPDRKLSEAERTRRGLIARRAYFARLTLTRVTASSKKNAALVQTTGTALGDGRADDAQPIAI